MARPPATRDASTVRRRMRAARIEAALTGPGTALLLGGILVANVLAYVLGLRGVLRPGAWAVGLAAGCAVVAVKVLFDLFDRDDDAALWREVLRTEFGDDMRMDAEVSRQARQAIEFRARLAEAEAKAGRDARARIGVLMPQLDGWLDGIVRLAREVGGQRGEAAFQSGLATRARSRRSQVQARAATDAELAPQLERTAEGLGAQIESAEGFSRYVEGGVLKLEQAVAAFGAVCSQLGLVLSRGAESFSAVELVTRITAENVAVDRQIELIGTAAGPLLITAQADAAPLRE